VEALRRKTISSVEILPDPHLFNHVLLSPVHLACRFLLAMMKCFFTSKY
jgi:hypothetical protein